MALDWIVGTDFVSSVAKAVRAEISEDELKLYKDKARQNFEYCSLYIDVLNLESVKQMRNTYNRTVFLDLRLHPARDMDNAQTWCRNMAERVLAATAFVQFKGRRVACVTSETYYVEKNEQIQHIILVYKYRVMLLPGEPDPDIFMETLEQYETIEYGKE